MISPFVCADQVREFRSSGRDVVLADCRWYLDGRSGRQAYDAGHLPGAVFVDLDADLAGEPSTAAGRHPLPDPAAFAAAMSRLGIGNATTVIGYDDAGGVIAARLVWLLRSLGTSAAVLDGGLDGWDEPLSTGPTAPIGSAEFRPAPWPAALLADLDEVSSPTSDLLVLDARPAERFRGEGADPDPRRGHIPGAVNVPCRENLTAQGRLLDRDTLRQRFAAAGVAADRVAAGGVVSSCGSGVTACHNLLALEHVGLGRARLYPGSWSQYAASDRPVETGG